MSFTITTEPGKINKKNLVASLISVKKKILPEKAQTSSLFFNSEAGQAYSSEEKERGNYEFGNKFHSKPLMLFSL